QVLLKVTALNAFYHTGILDTYPVAKHIVALRIDARLASGDPSLVNELAVTTIAGKKWNFYSFASKYCCQHNRERFPIYDEFVRKVLEHLRNTDHFSTFSTKELK